MGGLYGDPGKREEGIVDFGQFGDWCPPMHTYPVGNPHGDYRYLVLLHDALFVSKMAERLRKMTLLKNIIGCLSGSGIPSTATI